MFREVSVFVWHCSNQKFSWTHTNQMTGNIKQFVKCDYVHLENILIKLPMYTGVTLCFCTGSFWHGCWPWPIDYLIRFWLIFVVILTLKFQGQIWNMLYCRQNRSDCHETKSIHIDWNLSLKCYHWVWPWQWPWPWIFRVKYGICYIASKNSPIVAKRKVNVFF